MSKYLPYRDAILAYIADHGRCDHAIAAELGLSWKHLSNHWHQFLKDSPEGQQALNVYQQSLHRSAFVNVKPRPEVQSILDLPPKTFPTRIPKMAGKVKGKWMTALLYGDTHFPFEDKKALAVVQAIAVDAKPDVIVHVGDGLDCYKLSSKFDPNPERLHTAQDEIDAYRVHLEQMAQLCPEARRYVLEGNHEDRMRRLLWSLPWDVQQLTSLRKVREVLQWPALLDLGTIGFTWIPLKEQTRTAILPKFIVKHGVKVSVDSAMSARREMKTHSYSGASGHTHRKGIFYQSKGGIDRGNYVWLELGCTCDLNPEYAKDPPNWQSGCAVIHFNTRTGGFHIEDFYIHEGNAMASGKEYSAT
jgi:predicted phosphodiesterase